MPCWSHVLSELLTGLVLPAHYTRVHVALHPLLQPCVLGVPSPPGCCSTSRKACRSWLWCVSLGRAVEQLPCCLAGHLVMLVGLGACRCCMWVAELHCDLFQHAVWCGR